jgi:8-oxo-dGTP diphosphatase
MKIEPINQRESPNPPLAHRIALSLLRRKTVARMMRYSFRQLQGWYTAGVVGVVQNAAGEILIVEHVFHPEYPWGLPGGWLNRGESPQSGLQRELREETGLAVRIVRPLLIENGFYFRTHLDISFLCLAQNEVQALSSELLAYRWVRPEALPELLPFHAASIAALAPGENEGFIE